MNFEIIRQAFGPLSQPQVDGINLLAEAAHGLPITHRAYVLATAWHETARTMQPIHERGKTAYFDKYNAGTAHGASLGNTQPGDGYRFRGRGYVQITGRRNYGKASSVVGVDLLRDPEKALDPKVAAEIIVTGLWQGWFTGKRLSDFDNYHDMRRTVNGLDCADKIAGYARVFEKALTAA